MKCYGYPATLAVLTMTPRWPSAFGSFWAKAAQASLMALNVPLTLTFMTRWNSVSDATLFFCKLYVLSVENKRNKS